MVDFDRDLIVIYMSQSHKALFKNRVLNKILWNMYAPPSVIAGMAHDLRFALRMILAHRWFSLAVVVTLALGIGLNTMVFTLVNAVLLKPVGVPDGARLVTLNHLNLKHGNDLWRVSLPELRELRAQNSTLRAIEGATDEEGVLGDSGIRSAGLSDGAHTTAGLFDMLETRPVLGRGIFAGGR